MRKMAAGTHIAIIHDPSRVDRMNVLEKELETQGIGLKDIHFVDAIKAETAECGISKAHRSCVRLAKDNRWPHVIIMEDDVRFLHDGAFQDFINGQKYLPQDWELYLAGVLWYKSATPSKGSVPYLKLSDFAGMHCYIVHHRFYDTFLTAPDHYHIDRWVCAIGKAKTFVCHPFVAMQHPGYSDQKKENVNYSHLERSLPLWKPKS